MQEQETKPYVHTKENMSEGVRKYILRKGLKDPDSVVDAYPMKKEYPSIKQKSAAISREFKKFREWLEWYISEKNGETVKKD